jgi:uncharacterized membrane protein YsdA (DUF1294 family)
MPVPHIYAVWYLIMINLVSAAATISDKRRARNRMRRVSENTLLLLAALGGSPAMLLTMLLIRHKTRHLKFMLGIPVIMLLQAAALWFAVVRKP